MGKRTRVVFKLAELFCGPGGLALGAKMARVCSDATEFLVEPVWANDIDPDACRTYVRNIHGGNHQAVVCGPVEILDFSSIPDFDALAFGFPCNDFSIVGEQLGFSGKYGPLYTFGVKALAIHAPQWFIAENVSGLLSAHNGAAFSRILTDLANAGPGYILTPHLYHFEDYGVPQYRHRIVVVGIRKDIGLTFKVPTPTTASTHVTARQAIETPPIPPNAPNHEFTRQSPAVVERLKHIPAGSNAWCDSVPESLRLNVRGARMSQIYRRLDPDRPAYTVTGSGGGGTHVYHWRENRALTNRERARLQTFPDDFVFEGSKESVRKQIGMAVPPKAASVIIEAILKAFAGIQYDYMEASISNGQRAPQLVMM